MVVVDLYRAPNVLSAFPRHLARLTIVKSGAVDGLLRRAMQTESANTLTGVHNKSRWTTSPLLVLEHTIVGIGRICPNAGVA